MVTQFNQILEGTSGKPIVYDVYDPKIEKLEQIVIFCHGYKGFKDWGAWHLVAETFAAAGIGFVKFNFSHNGGTAEQPIDFPDLEAFGQNNYIKELDDLASVIDAISNGTIAFANKTDKCKLTLIGHSRGGGIVLIKTAEDSRVHKVITWAGVSDYASRYPSGQALEEWRRTGVAYVENGRTKQQMPHYFQFYTTFFENEERLTIRRAIRSIDKPILIIHGTEDPTVSIKEAYQLHDWNPRSAFYTLPTDHVFDARHPWETITMPDALQKVVARSIEFVKR